MATIEGIDSKEWFKRAAQRQKQSNKFAAYTPPPASKPAPKADKPTVAATQPKPQPKSEPPTQRATAPSKPAPQPTTPKPAAPKKEPPNPVAQDTRKPWQKKLDEAIKEGEARESRIADLDRRMKAENERFSREEKAKEAVRSVARQEAKEAAPLATKAIVGIAEGGSSLAKLLEDQRRRAARFSTSAVETAKGGLKTAFVGDVDKRRRAAEKMK